MSLNWSGESHQAELTFTSPPFSSSHQPATSALPYMHAAPRLAWDATPSPRCHAAGPSLGCSSLLTVHCSQLLLLPYQNSHCPPFSPLQNTQKHLHAKSNYMNGELVWWGRQRYDMQGLNLSFWLGFRGEKVWRWVCVGERNGGAAGGRRRWQRYGLGGVRLGGGKENLKGSGQWCVVFS